MRRSIGPGGSAGRGGLPPRFKRDCGRSRPASAGATCPPARAGAGAGTRGEREREREREGGRARGRGGERERERERQTGDTDRRYVAEMRTGETACAAVRAARARPAPARARARPVRTASARARPARASADSRGGPTTVRDLRYGAREAIEHESKASAFRDVIPGRRSRGGPTTVGRSNREPALHPSKLSYETLFPRNSLFDCVSCPYLFMVLLEP